MNKGKYLFLITSPQCAKSVIDQLGWDSETFGHWHHGLSITLQYFWLSKYIINKINDKRRQDLFRERAEQEMKT